MQSELTELLEREAPLCVSSKWRPQSASTCWVLKLASYSCLMHGRRNSIPILQRITHFVQRERGAKNLESNQVCLLILVIEVMTDSYKYFNHEIKLPRANRKAHPCSASVIHLERKTAAMFPLWMSCHAICIDGRAKRSKPLLYKSCCDHPFPFIRIVVAASR